jgi:hypothetical protein
VKRLLKLQDHKHTAKKSSHEHTSYRGLSILLILFGICLLLISRSVNAASYMVTAGVPAPIPSSPAEITNPVTGSAVTNPNIVISGTCPVIIPAIVVMIYDNNNYIGSAGCSASGVFAGSFTISSGVNSLVPKIVTITNDAGPTGQAVSITYQQASSEGSTPPVTPQQPVTLPVTTPSQPIETSTSVLKVNTDTPFLVIKPNESLVWKINVNGGESPYTIIVDWGDGVKTTYSANSAGEQSLEHLYRATKNRVIRISVKDATGKEVYTTVAGVTFRQQTGVVAGAIQTTGGTYISLCQIWVIYLLIVALVPLLWFEARHRQLIVVTSKRKHNSRSR